MSTVMKMENVRVLEDTSNLLANGVTIHERHLWCEPLTTDADVTEAKRHLLLTKVPFIHAKFDTTVADDAGTQMYRRVSGLFVRKQDLWENQEEEHD